MATSFESSETSVPRSVNALMPAIFLDQGAASRCGTFGLVAIPQL
jgi:hypothetical protein